MVQIIKRGGGGGGGKVCDYVADVPYECWEGESKAISGDKIYAKVSTMDTTLNTALQPGDNVSELCNDAGYATSDSIGDGTLTISKNGTQINTFTANQSSNVGVDIEVPTDTSDLTNGAGFIDNTVSDLCCYTLSGDLCTVATSGQYCDLSGTPDLSGYQTTSNMVTTLSGADDTHYPTAKTVADALSCAGAGDMLKSVYDPNNCNADAFNYDNFYNKPAIIDSLCCTSTTDALSANQGKALKDLIDTYVGLGRFLSLWNASTGQPISFPLTTPYTYNTGDWYMVEVTGATNYMPNGSSYTGAASTTVDSTNNVEVRDVYIYDGTDWLFQKNNEVQVSFSDIAGVPNDNACLCAALAAKADTSSLCTVSTSGKYCDLTGLPTIPTNNNQLANGCGYTTCTGTLVASDLTPYAKTCTLCTVSTSGKYCDLSGTPTIGTATLSICKNGTLVNSFGANATSNVGVNITVPTDTCQLTNTAGFTTCTGTLTQSAISDTAFASSWNGDTTHAPSKNAVYDVLGDVETLLANL